MESAIESRPTNQSEENEKMSSNKSKNLYLQVLAAIAIGVLLGHFFPDIGTTMKPLGDGFIKLI